MSEDRLQTREADPLVSQWLDLVSSPYVDPSKLRLVGTKMGNEIMCLQAEITQLQSENAELAADLRATMEREKKAYAKVEEMRTRIAKLVEDNDCIPELEAEIERLMAIETKAQAFLRSQTTENADTLERAFEIKDGIGWKPDPTRPGWKIPITDSDYVAEIEKLRAALKPFANAGKLTLDQPREAGIVAIGELTVGDLRRAYEAIESGAHRRE